MSGESSDLSKLATGFPFPWSAYVRLLYRILQSAPTQAYFFIEAPDSTRYGLGQDAIGDLWVFLSPQEHRGAIADWVDRATTRIDALIAKKIALFAPIVSWPVNEKLDSHLLG
ncbi:MAG: hypothetical protein ACYDBH_23460 [Acidobacteriaceae bacterium]